ncbi:hypothetical protein BWP11_21730 [Aeromonas hydrophila]|nr:hypothetical protein BWP11_21730 [Aeromonas hydrophila]
MTCTPHRDPDEGAAMGRHHLLLLRVIIIILLSAANASTTEWHTRMGGGEQAGGIAPMAIKPMAGRP